MYLYWTSVGVWIVWWVYWLISARFAARTKSSESWLARMTHLVPLGLAFFLIFHDPHDAIFYGILYRVRWLQAVGVAVTATGLSFAVWARVHLGKYWSAMITLKREHKLIRSGPYRFVRHPIYTGFLTAAIGSAITIGSGDAWVGVAILVPTFLVKIWREERFLSVEFGEEYIKYRTDVPKLVPFVY
jgi:protein-S-isoprenylcysteine O-methyltransferase Ste14